MFGFSAFAELPFATVREAAQNVISAVMGGLPPKKVKTKFKKNEHDDIAEIVKREFDKLEKVYEPEVVVAVKENVLPKITEITEIDYESYEIALAQVNTLLLQAKIKAAEYEAELDDEEAILMLL